MPAKCQVLPFIDCINDETILFVELQQVPIVLIINYVTITIQAMGLYRLFSYNVEVQYKSFLLSKATFFTVITTFLTLFLPFVIAYRSRGFWLKSEKYFEQPTVFPTYEYLLIAETGDPTQPIVCGNDANNGVDSDAEFCAETQINELDQNEDNKNDMIHFFFHINLPTAKNIVSLIMMVGFDFQLKSVCPFHMQSLGIIQKEFVTTPSGVNFFGDLNFKQSRHLPCLKYEINTKYNYSLFDTINNDNDDLISSVFAKYYDREVINQFAPMYTRIYHGQTKSIKINVNIRIPEVKIRYTPSFLQELKWAWPQYLSLVVIFYWFFNKIKRFVFNKRLLMAWEVVPWKKSN